MIEREAPETHPHSPLHATPVGRGKLSTPVPASTVLLIKAEPNSDTENFSLFFVRRHSKSAFMANAYVFPGGKVDGADSDPALHRFSEGLAPEEAANRLGDVPPEVAVGYYIAAIRETFEEAGVLFADIAQDTPLSLTEEETYQRFERYRKQVHENSISLSDLAQEEGLIYRPDRLHYWDHWVTPEVEERRFSARFFLAQMPDGFRPNHDSMETTDSGWFTPTTVLERYEADRLVLAPPTLRILLELKELGSMEALWEAAKTRTVDVPNLPVAHRDESSFYLLLPGDRDYPGSTAEGLHRARMVQGRWELIRE